MNQGRKGGLPEIMVTQTFRFTCHSASETHMYTSQLHQKFNDAKGAGRYHELRTETHILQNLLRTCVDPVLYLFSSGTPTTLMTLAQQ